jgi:SAM-dependent methyltransferase
VNGSIPGHEPSCRFCGEPLRHTFVDLGMSPLSESYLDRAQLDAMEPFYPLHVRVCSRCFLVQLSAYVSGEEIFTEYAYFSSYSTSWVEHARRYVDAVVERFGLGADSFVVELASNDGYLLQHFLPLSVPVLGIEPALNVAKVAVEQGIPTLTEFFGVALATRLRDERSSADLIIGNNVLAQVPDLNDFVAGMKILLAPGGVITLEFPHLQRLIAGNQFDTIYHEHYSYFSLFTTMAIFQEHGLVVFDVEELPTHGGSLRVYGCHAESTRQRTQAVEKVLSTELADGVNRLAYYESFGEQVKATKRTLVRFLVEAADAGKQVAGYGAPGKGNTLLNYCGIREDLLAYTVDRNTYKHGKYLPGTHIPIYDVDHIAATRPDYLLILPWNLTAEIVAQTEYIRAWGGRHVVPIPEVKVFE